MIFYEAVLKIQSKEEGRNKVYEWCSRLSEELELKQRELATEHRIVFHLRSKTLTDYVVIMLASQKPVDSQKLEHILTMLIPDAEIIVNSLNEIRFYNFIRSTSNMNREIHLFHELGVEGAMNLENPRTLYEDRFEFICPQIDDVDYAYQSGSLKEEVQRIQVSARDEFKPGNPAHYAIHTSSETMMHELLSVLVDSLFKAKRLISRRVFVIDMGIISSKVDSTSSKGSDDSLSWLEPFCLMSAGGTILVKVPYISFGFSQSPKSEPEMRKMRYLSIVEKLFSLNKGRTQFVFAFDPVYYKENIKLALAETFPPHDRFVTIFVQGIRAASVKEFLEAEARRNHMEVDESLFATLEKKAEYSEKELREHLEGWSRHRLVASEYPEYEAIRPIDVDKLKPKTSVLSELETLIGLAETKRQIKRVIANIKFQESRHKEGLNNQQPCLHMMFMGNPGTGKTTVARIIGEIYVSNGIIPCGRFYEVSPASMGDVSWSDIFEQARGSVLFIDEAYTLNDGAVDQLVPYLENYREDTVVIFAGYKTEMKKFLGRNSGLASRIPYHIDFPNYTPAELIEIIESVLVEKNYTVSAHTRKMLQYEFRRLRLLDGNARDIRTLVEKAISEAAYRLSQFDPEALTQEELQTLKLSDFMPELRYLGKEHRRKVASNVFGSPLFTIPATHTVKLAGRAIGSKVSGKRMTRKDVLALVPEMAISIGTELAMHSINKASSTRNH